MCNILSQSKGLSTTYLSEKEGKELADIRITFIKFIGEFKSKENRKCVQTISFDTGGRPKAVLSLRSHLCYVWCCSVFKRLNFITSVCPFI